MTRSSKVFIPARSDGKGSSAPTYSWTKYGGPETVGGRGGTPSAVEVTVDDITVVENESESTPKYEMREAAARDLVRGGRAAPANVPDDSEWLVDRRITGRRYHRTDTLVSVEASG